MSPTEVEAWLARPPGPEDVHRWAAARLTVAEAERLRAEGVDGEALLRLARRDREAAATRLRLEGALGAMSALGVHGSRRATSGPAESLPIPQQGDALAREVECARRNGDKE